MGNTIEFYSAEPDAFVEAYEDDFMVMTDRFLSADFSFHLLWPDDMDRLCRTFGAIGLPLPDTVDELLEEVLTTDEVSEWVWRVSESLPRAAAQMDDRAITRLATSWVAAYAPDPHTDLETYQSMFRPAHQALTSLREISRDALEHRRSLVLLYSL